MIYEPLIILIFKYFLYIQKKNTESNQQSDENAKKDNSTKAKPDESDNEDDYEANATLFVKNLNFDTTEEGLQKVNN